MVMARRDRTNPRKMAEQLLAELRVPAGLVSRTEVAGPGFINFWLADDQLVGTLDAGADDLQDDDDNWEVLSSPEAFAAVRDAVKALGIEPASAQVSMIPQNYVKLEGKVATQMVKLMDALDEHDDVQHVWSNFDISEKEIEASLA
jgi:transcriptional/translational regulatory protein YebC/TACO1